MRFEDPDAKGLEEWVPDGRLKCQWADAEAFSARERRWAAVKSASIVSDDIDWAVGVTLDSLTPMGMIDGCGGRTGISPYKIGDVSALSRLCGIPEDDLTSPPTAFKEGERFIVPFETAARVARTLAAQHPEVVLRAVEREERDFEERQYEWRQHGSPPRGRKFEAWDEALRRSFQMRRDWVGKHHDVLWREVLIARIEVQRMRELVESAANMLQANGHMASAARLRRSLNPNAKPE
ncbi:hypothetical protein SAMN04487914_111121 [Arthrobacter sp. ok909]|nr:hypothetical protein SAMN04487914_111121 [Arthrobacter sp. ok909]